VFLGFTNIDFHFAVDIPEEIDYRPLRTGLVAEISAGAIEVEEAFISPRHERQLDELE
jgi:hypothetical protein